MRMPLLLTDSSFDDFISALREEALSEPTLTISLPHDAWCDISPAVRLVTELEHLVRSGSRVTLELPRYEIPGGPRPSVVYRFLHGLGLLERLSDSGVGVRFPDATQESDEWLAPAAEGRTTESMGPLFRLAPVLDRQSLRVVEQQLLRWSQRHTSDSLLKPAMSGFYSVICHELCDNVYKHNSDVVGLSGWIACRVVNRLGQRTSRAGQDDWTALLPAHPSDVKLIELCVHDTGHGLAETLKKRVGGCPRDDAAVIKEAFKGLTVRDEAPVEERHTGLPDVKSQVMQFGGAISVRTGTTRVTYIATAGTDEPSIVPEEVSWSPGTTVSVLFLVTPADPPMARALQTSLFGADERHLEQDRSQTVDMSAMLSTANPEAAALDLLKKVFGEVDTSRTLKYLDFSNLGPTRGLVTLGEVDRPIQGLIETYGAAFCRRSVLLDLPTPMIKQLQQDANIRFLLRVYRSPLVCISRSGAVEVVLPEDVGFEAAPYVVEALSGRILAEQELLDAGVDAKGFRSMSSRTDEPALLYWREASQEFVGVDVLGILTRDVRNRLSSALRDDQTVLHGHFLMPSAGHHAETYIDVSVLLQEPEYRWLLAREMGRMILSSGATCVVSCSPTGVLLASLVADSLAGVRLITLDYSYKEAEAAFHRARLIPGERVALVTDVVLTGRLVGKMRRAVLAAGAAPVLTVAVINAQAGSATEDIRWLLRRPVEIWSPLTCPACEDVKPLTHIMEFSLANDTAAEIRTNHRMERNWAFWTAAHGTQALRSHVATGDRHYLYYVDTAALLSEQSNRRMVEESSLAPFVDKSLAGGEIDTVLSVGDLHNEAAQPLAVAVARRLGSTETAGQDVKIVTAQRVSRSEFTVGTSASAHLSAAKGIIVVDDGANTSETISDILGWLKRFEAPVRGIYFLLNRLTPNQLSHLRSTAATQDIVLGDFFWLGIPVTDESSCPMCRRERFQRENVLPSATSHSLRTFVLSDLAQGKEDPEGTEDYSQVNPPETFDSLLEAVSDSHIRTAILSHVIALHPEFLDVLRERAGAGDELLSPDLALALISALRDSRVLESRPPQTEWVLNWLVSTTEDSTAPADLRSAAFVLLAESGVGLFRSLRPHQLAALAHDLVSGAFLYGMHVAVSSLPESSSDELVNDVLDSVTRELTPVALETRVELLAMLSQTRRLQEQLRPRMSSAIGQGSWPMFLQEILSATRTRHGALYIAHEPDDPDCVIEAQAWSTDLFNLTATRFCPLLESAIRDAFRQRLPIDLDSAQPADGPTYESQSFRVDDFDRKLNRQLTGPPERLMALPLLHNDECLGVVVLVNADREDDTLVHVGAMLPLAAEGVALLQLEKSDRVEYNRLADGHGRAVHAIGNWTSFLESTASDEQVGVVSFLRSQVEVLRTGQGDERRSRPEDTSLSSIAAMVEPLRAYVESQHRAYTVECVDPDAPVRVDVKVLIWTLAELVLNATKFSTKGNRVCVRLSADDARVRIDVEGGVGLQPPELAKVFDDGFRGTAADTLKCEGHGRGLYAARNEVERLLGGSISMDSTMTEGTRVCVDFPRAT